MSTVQRCPVCGTERPPDAPQGLCPVCLCSRGEAFRVAYSLLRPNRPRNPTASAWTVPIEPRPRLPGPRPQQPSEAGLLRRRSRYCPHSSRNWRFSN